MDCRLRSHSPVFRIINLGLSTALSSTYISVTISECRFRRTRSVTASSTWMLLHTVLNIRYCRVNVTSRKSSTGKRPGYRSPGVIPQQARANRGLDFHRQRAIGTRAGRIQFSFLIRRLTLEFTIPEFRFPHGTST